MLALPISKSDAIQSFDTLPALKVRHFVGESRQGPLYTMAQMYVYQDNLALRLSAFEQTPEKTSSIGFCISARQDCALFINLYPQSVQLSLCTKSQEEPLSPPLQHKQAGEDEQGWYWGAELFICAEYLQQVGFVPTVESEFFANLFKLDDAESAYGCAFKVPHNQPLWAPVHSGRFQVVAY